MNIADPLAQQKAPAGEHGAETGTKQHITHADTDVNGDAESVQTITIESVYDIAETPENWTIYRRPDESDIKLAQFGAQLNAFAGEHFKGVA